MIMTDVFLEKLNYDVNMIAKMVIIFAEIEHIKNQRVTFWPKRIGLVFTTLWSGHNFGHEF